MKEDEFRKLLDKHLQGTLTNSEEKVLGEFIEKMGSIEDANTVFLNNSHKDQIKKSIWNTIDKSVAPRKTLKSRTIAASIAAAVFIGLLVSNYFFFETTPTFLNSIPVDAITLELEDGSVRIIQENGKSTIINKEGSVVGQQNGNQLVYDDHSGSTMDELVFNTLTVPYGKTFELLLSDGTVAHLNAGSSLKYPVQFLPGKDRQVFITGEAYMDVAKDSLHPFVVSAEKLNVRVLGTQFNVSAYPEDKTTEVVLVEGSVSMYTDSKGFDLEKSTLLTPGVKGSFDRIKNGIETKVVVTSIYTSWTSGKLLFRNMTFENILKKLERHYNVVIINNNTELINEEFNANFGNEPIENVLNELKDNYGIKYRYEDDKIIIE